jgi:hypothetical protein
LNSWDLMDFFHILKNNFSAKWDVLILMKNTS